MAPFAIVARPDDISSEIETKLKRDLMAQGYVENSEKPHTVFVIGGDGTFIYAVHKYLEQLNDVKFYGIHTGTLGFYTDYQDKDYAVFLETFLSGEMEEVTYPLLEACSDHHVYHAINEIRIENAARTQSMHILVNGEFFEDFRGTGMCVATQLGSTAYNRSLGGAVLQEGLPLIELTEISGIHHNKYRSLGAPFVMKDDVILEFRSDDFSGALLGADSDVFQLAGETFVSVRKCTKIRVHMLKGRHISYFERLTTLF
ncbi:MAG: NAD kinase [Erysipelotrichia bacterium]|nr:NAD kinase [Erysipelotrichia bacterium]